MAGFTSYDDYLNQTTVNGKRKRVDWQKSFTTTVGIAGDWHCLARGAGNPAADALYTVPTTLHMQHVSYETQTAAFHGGMPYGGVVGATGADYKQIVAAGAWTAAATVAPCILMLVDLLAFVNCTAVGAATDTIIDHDTTGTRSGNTCSNTTLTMLNGTPFRFTTTAPTGCSVGVTYWSIGTGLSYTVAATYADAIAGTAITLSGATSGWGIQTRLPRYSDGAGVQAFMWASSVAMGAGTPNLSIAYTRYGDAIGTGGRATPTVLPSGTNACPFGRILYSGTGSGKYGPFMPLQAADQGIVSLETTTRSSTYTTGPYAIALCQPLLQIPITTLGVPGERNLMHQIPSMPRVYDGANLIWLINSGAATPASSPICGALEFAWS